VSLGNYQKRYDANLILVHVDSVKVLLFYVAIKTNVTDFLFKEFIVQTIDTWISLRYTVYLKQGLLDGTHEAHFLVTQTSSPTNAVMLSPYLHKKNL
jgi:hypothetical protein